MTTESVLCAVSGGSDSMYMLSVLLEQGGRRICAAHFNHGMRGAESDSDAQFVKNYCDGLGIECIIGRADSELKSEEDARNARYAFLERARVELNCELIATAHNADDNAETVIFNLARGTGLKGLCGIPERRGNIIRPILNVSRSEIESYLEERGIPHVEDSTNAGLDYSRNIIRHKVMPVLKEINPGFTEAVRRMTLSLRDDESFLEAESERHGIAEITGLDTAIASRVVRNSCPGQLSARNVSDVLALAKGGTEYAELDLPGAKIVRDSGVLSVNPAAPQFEVCFEECIYTEVNKSLNTCFIKNDSIVGHLAAGVWECGDSMRIRGRNCSKSLKKLFLEAGLTKVQKDNWPVIRDEKGVMYVYNLAMAERAEPKIGDRAIKITVTERENGTGH